MKKIYLLVSAISMILGTLSLIIGIVLFDKELGMFQSYTQWLSVGFVSLFLIGFALTLLFKKEE